MMFHSYVSLPEGISCGWTGGFNLKKSPPVGVIQKMSPSNGPIGCFSKATKDSDVWSIIKIFTKTNIANHLSKNSTSFGCHGHFFWLPWEAPNCRGKASKCHWLGYRILKQPKTYQVGDLHPIISHSYGHILVITGDKWDFSSCHKRGFFVL